MSLSNKSQSTQVFRMLLFQRALHPELFNIHDRRAFTNPEYEVESWLYPGGHLLRFQTGGHCMTEVVADQDLSLPERGLAHQLPCIGEKEYEHAIEGAIKFVAAVQTENLSDNLYQATLSEMREFANETEAMRVEYEDGAYTNFSMIDIQRFRKEIHAQSYHLIGAGGFVLRTQSIFELL